jgi:glutathione peroxidase
MTVHDFKAKDITGKETPLSQYDGKVLLIVNVASQCGFTPQYAGLETLYEKYRDKGFTVLGFPCNQFGSQEPGTESEIKSFCETSFGVKFPLFSKIDVNGSNTHPLYEYLKSNLPGILGSEAIKWNFTKFLVDAKGQPIKRYGSADKPESIEPDIQGLLGPA